MKEETSIQKNENIECCIKHFQMIRNSHRRCSLKKILCAAVSLDFQLYLKCTPTEVFSCKYCEIFKNTNFEEYLRTTASE